MPRTRATALRIERLERGRSARAGAELVADELPDFRVRVVRLVDGVAQRGHEAGGRVGGSRGGPCIRLAARPWCRPKPRCWTARELASQGRAGRPRAACGRRRRGRPSLRCRPRRRPWRRPACGPRRGRWCPRRRAGVAARRPEAPDSRRSRRRAAPGARPTDSASLTAPPTNSRRSTRLPMAHLREALYSAILPRRR